jgi:hypothetical protein
VTHPDGLREDPTCGLCAQQRAVDGFRTVDPATVTCPSCGHSFDPNREAAMRVTEADTSTPYGDVEYADPGYQDDGKKRYPIDTEDHVRAAWSYINQEKHAAKYSPANLKKVKARIKAAMKRLDIQVSENSTTEATINGKRSFDDIRELVRRALHAHLRTETDPYCWAHIVDISDTDVVYMAEDDRLFQCSWSLSGDTVTLGDAVEVERTYAPASSGDEPEATTTESRQVVETTARVLEAKGKASDGGRIFGVRVIAYGDSKNNRRYPETVLRSAASLYEGAKAYDHHRSDDEMRSGTIAGLVGYYRNATATSEGLEADLHLLPSATHAAEALDAALSLQGSAPLVGISHDVFAKFRSIQENGRHIQEATEITSVNSADIVAHPAAGGQATRVVAGGIDNPDPAGTVPAGLSTEESGVTPQDVLAALKEATDEQLAAVGLAKAEPTTETVKPEGEKATENGEPKTSFLGKLLIKQKVAEAGLPESVVEGITTALPDRISESDVDAQIGIVKTMAAGLERAGLTPTATTQVTQESIEKKKTALDAFFAADYKNGYRSFKEAFVDFTGRAPKAFDEDFNRTILRESLGEFDSQRSTESLDSTTWNLALGDSITRRMVAEYGQPSLQTWRQIVSSTVPVNDFRTQRIDRVGGYGTLPAVNQGAPYQPLTSPDDEEVTYAITKRGGTEDVTLEMIANDDVRAIQRIPKKLGLAAAQTLFRFVWDFLDTSPAIYDGTSLFHASHNNTNTAALSQSNLSAARLAMRSQAAYGDSSNILSLTPKTLVVVNDLEEIAYQLTRSAVAIPATPAGPSDTPNIHQGLNMVVVDYWGSTTKWIAVADPMLCPTFELGFYQGREEPELFTQSDPNTGSTFNADKVTYKIRHIYSGAVLDFRGFYRGNT